MPKPLKILITILILAIIVWIVATKGEKPTTEVKIGVIAPLTGARSDSGEFTKNAIMLAERKINESKNQYKVTFVIEDSKYEAPIAVSALKKLIELDGVKYVIGPNGSSEVLATGPIAEKSKVILLINGAQSIEISSLGDYIFRIIHNSAQEAPLFAKFVAQKMKGDTIHFLVINTAVSDPYIKIFKPVIESLGKNVGLVERFDQKATDFKTELTKIKSLNPTDIFIVAAAKQGAILLRQARDLGIEAQFYNIGVEGPEFLTQSGGASEGLLYPYSYDSTSAEPNVKEFYDSYKTTFNSDPDTIAANSYDAAMLLSTCFERVGIEVDTVKKCLYDTKEYRGAGGTFSIDQNGDAIKNIFIKTIKDGKFVKYE